MSISLRLSLVRSPIFFTVFIFLVVSIFFETLLLNLTALLLISSITTSVICFVSLISIILSLLFFLSIHIWISSSLPGILVEMPVWLLILWVNQEPSSFFKLREIGVVSQVWVNSIMSVFTSSLLRTWFMLHPSQWAWICLNHILIPIPTSLLL